MTDLKATSVIERRKEMNLSDPELIKAHATEYNKLYEKIFALEAELGNYKSNWDALASEALEFEDENKHLQSDNKQLREALGRYGEHKYSCAASKNVGICNCGLYKALKENKND